MEENGKTIKLFNPSAKVLLDYDVRILQEILDSLRNEPLTSSAQVLREYEYSLIKAYRLDQDRKAKEFERVIRERIEGDIE